MTTTDNPMAGQKLIFYGKQFHIIIQGNMFLNGEGFIRTMQDVKCGKPGNRDNLFYYDTSLSGAS